MQSTLFTTKIADISIEQIALTCLREITSRFPMGGINIMANITKFPNHMALERAIRDIEALPTPILNEAIPTSITGGYCDHLARYALQYIHKHHPELNVELVGFDAHVLVVLNRLPQSDPNTMETWGEQAVLVDPWARKIIRPDLVTGFSQEGLLQLPAIPFCKNFTVEDSSDEHYMTGKGKIAIQHTLQEYDLLQDREFEDKLKQSYSTHMRNRYTIPSDKTLPDIHCCFRRAANEGHIEQLKILYCLGANIFATSKNGNTALAWAQKSRHQECVLFLQNQMNDVTESGSTYVPS